MVSDSTLDAYATDLQHVDALQNVHAYLQPLALHPVQTYDADGYRSGMGL
jgi:L-rhamnose isomerase